MIGACAATPPISNDKSFFLFSRHACLRESCELNGWAYRDGSVPQGPCRRNSLKGHENQV